MPLFEELSILFIAIQTNMIAGISRLLTFEPRWHWYHRSRLSRRARAGRGRQAGTGGQTARGGGSASASKVEANGRHDVRRRKRARAPTTSEPSNVLVTRVVQTRRLPLAVAGEHDRERGLGELTVTGLRREEFVRNGKGTGRMGSSLYCELE